VIGSMGSVSDDTEAMRLDLWDLSLAKEAGLDLWDLSLDDTTATELDLCDLSLDNTGAERRDWIYGIFNKHGSGKVGLDLWERQH
jgi:hypothetical protein